MFKFITFALLMFLYLSNMTNPLKYFSNFYTYSYEYKHSLSENSSHWFVLHRQSNVEFLYLGKPGDTSKSLLLNIFKVKTGEPLKKPTPLPYLLGRKYWIITEKHPEFENLETAPYFLTLDIPISNEPPFGPTPYLECGIQCDWEKPGYFGLHGIGGDVSKLSNDNPGSSGCIRHTDEDITYLYNVLQPDKEEIRYYIVD